MCGESIAKSIFCYLVMLACISPLIFGGLNQLCKPPTAPNTENLLLDNNSPFCQLLGDFLEQNYTTVPCHRKARINKTVEEDFTTTKQPTSHSTAIATGSSSLDSNREPAENISVTVKGEEVSATAKSLTTAAIITTEPTRRTTNLLLTKLPTIVSTTTTQVSPPAPSTTPHPRPPYCALPPYLQYVSTPLFPTWSKAFLTRMRVMPPSTTMANVDNDDDEDEDDWQS